MSSWYETGLQRVDDAIKQSQPVAPVLQSMVNDLGVSSGAEELSGALWRMTQIIELARKSGLRFTGNDAAVKFLCRPVSDIRRDLNRAFAQSDAKAIGRHLGALAAAISQLREKNLISFPVRAPETPKPADPLKVEVVALPPRVTKSTVERNLAGEIISTAQVEMDA